MKGEIRKGKEESESIPLSPPRWFMVIVVKKNKIREIVFQTSKTDKKALFEFLVLNRQYCKVYGVWNGEWNTHLFSMDIKILKRRLEKDTSLNEIVIKESILSLIDSLSSKFPIEEVIRDIAKSRNILYDDIKYLSENRT